MSDRIQPRQGGRKKTFRLRHPGGLNHRVCDRNLLGNSLTPRILLRAALRCCRQSASVQAHRDQLRDAPGGLDGLDRLFSRESPHKQCQLTIGSHSDRSPIQLLDVFSRANPAAIHSHKKFDNLHDSFLSRADKANDRKQKRQAALCGN